MNVQANTDHIAMAGVCVDEADRLCYEDITDDTATAMAQVQAILGVGHAILALAQHFRGFDAPTVPISPERSRPLTDIDSTLRQVRAAEVQTKKQDQQHREGVLVRRPDQ